MLEFRGKKKFSMWHVISGQEIQGMKNYEHFSPFSDNVNFD